MQDVPNQAEVLGALFLDLHKVVMTRVNAAAIPYANSLLQHLTSASREERKRIARELHDRVAYAIAVSLQQLELRDIALERGDQHDAEQRLLVLGHSLREVAFMVQEMAVDIGTAVGDAGLEDVLARLVEQQGPGRVELTFVGSEAGAGAPEWFLDEVYLTIREAVRNAVAHSDASSIAVDVRQDDRQIHASIRDDGRGFSPKERTSASSGKGLVAMAERIELVGGTVRIESQPGRGTEVEILVPFVDAT